MLKTIRSPRQELLQQILIDARRKAELTQIELARKVERPQSFVAKYENGERRLDVSEFIEIVEAIGADLKRLFARLIKGA